jgi:hypothetical protein
MPRVEKMLHSQNVIRGYNEDIFLRYALKGKLNVTWVYALGKETSTDCAVIYVPCPP